ncbi:MAG: thioredoxin [Ruminococcaceae bacterium]|nr:thioredoxin [Oscillospiraceae bacterium]MBE6698416.1 thioredoxin [Oscillospiraceae bacterium]
MPAYTTIVLQVVLIVVAVCMIVAGIFNGSMNDVLQKAIRICTECIGLG